MSFESSAVLPPVNNTCFTSLNYSLLNHEWRHEGEYVMQPNHISKFYCILFQHKCQLGLWRRTPSHHSLIIMFCIDNPVRYKHVITLLAGRNVSTRRYVSSVHYCTCRNLMINLGLMTPLQYLFTLLMKIYM